MTAPSSDTVAVDGYRLQAVIAQELHLEGIGQSDSLPDSSALDFGWEWKAHSETNFDVILTAEAEPCKPRPERLRVLIFGRFSRTGQPVPDFPTFIKLNAVAILFPYLREAISSLTGKGGVGPFYLDPINVERLASSIQIETTYGAAELLKQPELAAAYGIDLGKVKEFTAKGSRTNLKQKARK